MSEGAAELNAEERCAIAHAFAKNKEAVTALKKVVEPAKLKAFADILINTERMALVPSAENKIAYEQIIKAELSRLTKEGSRGFHCKHSAEEHVASLNTALEKVRITVQ